MEQGEQKSSGGILLPNDDATQDGIRPRWMQVAAVGPEVRDVMEGQWVMVEHGRWTHGMTLRNDENQDITFWSAEEESVLLVADEKPEIDRSPTSANWVDAHL